MNPQLCVFWRPFSICLLDPAHQGCLGRFIGSLWFPFGSFWTVSDTFSIPKWTYFHIYTYLPIYRYTYISLFFMLRWDIIQPFVSNPWGIYRCSAIRYAHGLRIQALFFVLLHAILAYTSSINCKLLDFR